MITNAFRVLDQRMPPALPIEKTWTSSSLVRIAPGSRSSSVRSLSLTPGFILISNPSARSFPLV